MLDISVRSLLSIPCLLLVLAWTIIAQTPPLPPAAQEAVNKGVIAAKVPDYLLAIRYFEEARKIAPDAPIIYLNLGIAESKIPGRELRAIAWFGAYLAAYPNAPNAAAVKEQITVLEIKNQSNVARLIRSVEGAAKLCCDKMDLESVAVLWAKSGDISSAIRVTTEMGADSYADDALQGIVRVQADAGDVAGALKTCDLAKNAYWKSVCLTTIAETKIKAGDLAGAQKTAELIVDEYWKNSAQKAIAEAQASVAKDEKQTPARSTVVTMPSVHAAIMASDWIERLDEKGVIFGCSLNSGPFLDLEGYLKSAPSQPLFLLNDQVNALPPNNPLRIFLAMRQTAEKLVIAQNVIHKMLKRQAITP